MQTPRPIVPAAVSAPPCAVSGEISPGNHATWFTQNVHPHDADLKAYVRASFPTVAEVEDVVQESYLRIWKAKARREIISARAFLFRIARNVATDVIRRRCSCPVRTIADVTAVDISEDKLSAPDTLSEAEKFAILTDAVGVLPERSRQLIVLCKIKGLTHREAAEQLGLSVKTVDEHILRALKKLSRELRRRGLEGYFRP